MSALGDNAGLQQLFVDRRDAGLTILAFPANDLGAQEPGDEPALVAAIESELAKERPAAPRS